MARRRPPERLEELARCAIEVFSERGYRRTQMADVAQRLGDPAPQAMDDALARETVITVLARGLLPGDTA